MPILTPRPITVAAHRYTGENLADLQAATAGRHGTARDALIRAHPHGAYPATYRDPAVSAEVWHSQLSIWQPLAPGSWVLQHPGGVLTVVDHTSVIAAYDVGE
ncbi:hypothetical protein [Nocardia asteroides]|uniref:hypothetical protein n=1 Tax=Nocardia asteroides TaxID=1824 RepID=UPI0033E4F19E